MAKTRCTLNLDEEVVDSFQWCARLQGISLSACVNHWLASTSEAAQYLAGRVCAERDAPAQVASEINTGLEVLREGYAGGAIGQARAARIAPPELSPPSCNTGGKLPRVNPKGAAV